MPNTTTPGETSTSPPRQLDSGPVNEWLASAHPSPNTARTEWSSAARLALIPLGRRFEAIRLPEDIAHGAAQSDEPSTVGAWLARNLRGPVIHDPGFRRYYALVPVGTHQAWSQRGTECLSNGTYLGVPRTDRAELDAETLASYWLVPVTRPGHLCKAATVLEAVLLARVLADEDES
ncbi:hypothetical protein OG828_28215 [Streptomyces sp. NBC_00457]|uniref:hypothetical protein n=1 Tax=Streptomyces sp. NBC_00457 TaxID=2975748 RepID=UPI002E200E35